MSRDSELWSRDPLIISSVKFHCTISAMVESYGDSEERTSHTNWVRSLLVVGVQAVAGWLLRFFRCNTSSEQLESWVTPGEPLITTHLSHCARATWPGVLLQC